MFILYKYVACFLSCIFFLNLPVYAQDVRPESTRVSYDEVQKIVANVKDVKLKKAIEKKKVTLHSTTYYKKLEN